MFHRALLMIIVALAVAGCASPFRYHKDPALAQAAADMDLCRQLAHTRSISYGLWPPGQVPETPAKREADAVRAELGRRNPSWHWDAIDAGRVRVGMTDVQAVCAWGAPARINRASYGDQWVYYRSRTSAQYIYVERGLVTAWN